MGQGQSTEDGGVGHTAGPRKTCYYETLGVSQQATDDEIKKAYRRKALELHPDRNYGNVEAATQQFAAVQAAYAVLSDAQERAWYDSHREAILRGQDAGDDGAADAGAWDGDTRITTAEDITQLYMSFDDAARLDLSDSPTGFYATLRGLFGRLADEEVRAASNNPDASLPPDYPSFGGPETAYEGAEGVRAFYAAWAGFATRKTFAWRDSFRLSEAPDRRTRRAMEKENARRRMMGVREFNDAVRALVAFVRRRDPRYVPNTLSDADRQQALRNMAAQQAARDRATNAAAAAEWVAPEWVGKSNGGAEDEFEGSFDESSEEERTVLECAVCAKTFKSESQFKAHEQSKKHRRAVQDIKRQMRRENKELGLDAEPDSKPGPGSAGSEDEGDQVDGDDNEADADDVADGEETQQTNSLAEPAAPSSALHEPEPSSASSDADSDYAPREAVEARLFGTSDTAAVSTAASDHGLAEDLDATALDSAASESKPVAAPKVGAAKIKRQKKEAAAAAGKKALPDEAFRCATCQAGFQSKTRLFGHINEMGHAKPVAAGANSGGTEKKQKKPKTQRREPRR